MAQRRLMTVFITIVVVTTILSKRTQALPTPTTASVPESTASNQTSAPASLGSSCVGGSLDDNALKLVLCSVREKARVLSNAYNTTSNGYIGMNNPGFSNELVAELTSNKQCVLPFLRQMTRYSELLEKTRTPHFNRLSRRLGRALSSLVQKLKSVCCENGDNATATSCCSQMNQQLPEVDVTGVTFDDNALRNLANSMYNLKSLDRCSHVDVKRSVSRNRKPGKRGKCGRRRRRGQRQRRGEKKSTSAGAAQAEPADAETATTKERKEQNRLASVMDTLLASGLAILGEDPDVSAGLQDVVNPTDTLAAELDAGTSDDGDDLTTTQTPVRGRRTRKRCRGKGKKTRGCRCRGRKGRKQRGRKNGGRKNRGGRKQRDRTNKARASDSRRGADNNEEQTGKGN